MPNRDTSQDLFEVFADDRVLDAISRGEHIDSADPLLQLLSSAREEAETAMPAPPTIDVPDMHPRRRGILRRSASAAAAGGASITSMLVAGGVAAALAVGGLGYAAYTSTQPNNLKLRQTHEAGDSSEGLPLLGSDGQSWLGSDDAGVGSADAHREQTADPEKNPRKDPRQTPGEDKNLTDEARSGGSAAEDADDSAQESSSAPTTAPEASAGAQVVASGGAQGDIADNVAALQQKVNELATPLWQEPQGVPEPMMLAVPGITPVTTTGETSTTQPAPATPLGNDALSPQVSDTGYSNRSTDTR